MKTTAMLAIAGGPVAPITNGSTTAVVAPSGRDTSRAGEDFRVELLQLVPQLRAFTRMLCGDWVRAEDLAQEALTRAWRYQGAFQPGSNLRAWLFTIARNELHSSRRRAWREAPYDQAAAEELPSNGVDQIWSSELADTLRALRSLPDQLRESLVLVGIGGLSYEEAARICGCPVGTAKSRVSRARRALMALLDGTLAVDGSHAPAAPKG